MEYDSTYYLGKHKLKDTTERNVIVSGVDEFIIHPNWNTHEERYTADIGIAILTKFITFNIRIAPICIWERTNDHKDLVEDNSRGYIAGWGLTEKGVPSEVPQFIKVPVVDDETCVGSHATIDAIKSETNFCVGDRTGTTPCKGLINFISKIKYIKFYISQR